MIWKLVWIYEGAQCLRLLECHIIFVAPAHTIPLKGTFSILPVTSAEAKSEPKTLFWNANSQIFQVKIAHLKKKKLSWMEFESDVIWIVDPVLAVNLEQVVLQEKE